MIGKDRTVGNGGQKIRDTARDGSDRPAPDYPSQCPIPVPPHPRGSALRPAVCCDWRLMILSAGRGRCGRDMCCAAGQRSNPSPFTPEPPTPTVCPFRRRFSMFIFPYFPTSDDVYWLHLSWCPSELQMAPLDPKGARLNFQSASRFTPPSVGIVAPYVYL